MLFLLPETESTEKKIFFSYLYNLILKNPAKKHDNVRQV